MRSRAARYSSGSRRERLTTVALMAAAAVTEKMDEGVLPAVFLAVGSSLKVGPAQLGAVALSRALAQAAASPLAGSLGDSLDRTRVVGAGCLAWSAATLSLAAATTLRQMAVVAAANGVGLAIALPALQSVVADAVPASERGRAFGGVGLAAGVGGMLAAFSATSASRRRFFAGQGGEGVEGWRVAFVAVAASSAAVGALTLLFAVDPKRRWSSPPTTTAAEATEKETEEAEEAVGDEMASSSSLLSSRHDRLSGSRKKNEKVSDPGEFDDGEIEGEGGGGGGGGGGGRTGGGRAGGTGGGRAGGTGGASASGSGAEREGPLPDAAAAPPPTSTSLLGRYLSETLRSLRAVSSVPSFRVLVAQGVFGSMPWSAMVFATLWMQLLGFDDVSAGSLAALFAASSAAGSLLGGVLGDEAARRTRSHRLVAPSGVVGGRGGVVGGRGGGGVGRIAVAQLSVACSIPLAWTLLHVLPTWGPCECSDGTAGAGGGASDPPPCSPRSKSCASAFAAVVALVGLVATWCGSNNSAVFAEIVPEELRSSVYAFDRSFEGAVGSLATPLVGVVAARVFGFSGDLGVAGAATAVAAASDASSAPPSSANLRQARALGSALLVCAVAPWTLCLAAYGLLYRFYPRDAAAAAASAAAASAPTAEHEASPLLELVGVESCAAPAAASRNGGGCFDRATSLLERGDGVVALAAADASSPLPTSSSFQAAVASLSRRSLEPLSRRF